MRVVEHLPIVGHVIAGCHLCVGNKADAERAAVNATIGFAMFPVNMVAEAVDEATRERSSRIKQNRLTSRPDWMRRHRQRTLRNICLPGSHHSATHHTAHRVNHSPMAVGWARCQGLDIRAQLTAGIRFLDIRVTSRDANGDAAGKGDIWCRSGDERNAVALCIRLRDVLVAVRDFIVANRSEIVAIHVTSGEVVDADRRSSVNWNDCQSVINELLRDKLIPEHMRDMPIGDIVDLGRNIIIYGLPEAKFSWKQLQYRWPNKSQPGHLETHLRGTMQELGLYRPTDLFWYQAECTPTPKMLARSWGGIRGLIAARHGGPEKFDSLEHLAACANRVVLRVLNDVNQLPMNVLTMDFISDQIIGRILELNESADRGHQVISTTIADREIDETDEIYPLPGHRLAAMNRTMSLSNSLQSGPGNTSFDFRLAPAPPVQIHETTM